MESRQNSPRTFSPSLDIGVRRGTMRLMKYANIREEELKNRVARDYFDEFDSAKIIGNIDFCVTVPDGGTQVPLFEIKAFLWAEAKKGKADVVKSLVQLILTIGKARTFDEYLPPAFLGAFDAQQIAFIPYSEIHDIFYVNDFNWNITPSNHETKEFKLVYEKVKNTIENSSLLFTFGSDDAEIAAFVKENFVVGKSETSKIRIDKNNFVAIYNKWLKEVKPTIAVNWDVAKKGGIIDGDFYLADLLSHDNETLKKVLFVLLKRDHYELDRKIDDLGFFSSKSTSFTDSQKAHTQFWNKYERPPKEEFWDYIVERRDLLVPQDVRERKGSFFTPQIWVELSQKHIADVLGENWQEEYYVWDCAAGTGNLLAGLTNKYNIWASTIDQQDVDVMHDRIKNGANLLEEHVFQFDFLNDDFAKLPKSLQNVISDPVKRKKLVVYINPPYAEAANYGKSKGGVSTTKIYAQFKEKISFAINELSSQFFARIYSELPSATLATFGSMKYITASNFDKFRGFFQAEYKKGFACPASTFDNVNGTFPIGFLVWKLGSKNKINKISEIECDILNNEGKFEGSRKFFPVKKGDVINDWLRQFFHKEDKQDVIGFLRFVGPDFQANSGVFFTSKPKQSDIKESRITAISKPNVAVMAIYLAVRQCFSLTWLNNRDQFLYPNDGWQGDTEFHNDCLAIALFHGKNQISSNGGANHWIPFTEKDVSAREKFDSHFMTDFIAGKLKPGVPLQFSDQAVAVFVAGKALWRYYHSQKNCNVNASFYDIREHFQGRNTKGVMNKSSSDETYTALICDLRAQLKLLAQKIVPKVYEYGFLKR